MTFEASHQSTLASIPGLHLSLVHPFLALLVRQPALLAISLQVTVALTLYEITINKVVDEASAMRLQFWWEVDRLTYEAWGESPSREQCWATGRQPYETAEAAYLAALEWVQTHSGAAQ